MLEVSVIDARIAFLMILCLRLLMDVLAVLVTLILVATGCALAPTEHILDLFIIFLL